MPLRSYGVLRGRVIDSRAESGADTPHFQVHVRAAGTDFRVAVNVRSQQAPPDLLCLTDEAFGHPLLSGLEALPEGFTDIPSGAGTLALDFIRGNLFDRTAMRPVPATDVGPDNDLADTLGHFTDRARADPTAAVFAFGERWGPEDGVPDKVFGFSPGNGVHDIHMNQGNNGRFAGDDGVWQDGALLFRFAGQWVAVFLAFQSQSWHTDDDTGHTLPGTTSGSAPAAGDPHGVVRLVAALVNPAGPAPEAETVTLLNSGADPVDLAGWSLHDGNDATMPLTGTLGAGDAVRVPVAVPVQLGNRGGTLSLLDAAGLKVDGVAWTAEQAVEGVSVVF
jgi:uncharacterized protein YukJ